MRYPNVKIVSVLAGLAACALVVPAQAQTSPAPYLTAYRYQDGGLLVGIIKPAPSGQSNFLATRNTYDPNGRLWIVETGVLAGWQAESVPPASWSGFTVGKTTTYSYDANGNKVQETIKGSYNVGTPVVTNVRQFSYDLFDRLDCTAVRLNPAAFGSLPASACTLGTAGPDGPDRISRRFYDTLSHVVQEKRGVGSTVEEAYATYGYTPDGLREYIIDANGNRTKLTYDGFDRQNGWYFPSTTGPTAFNPSTQVTALASAGTASTTDYESYGYDANGNRTSLKKRDGQYISYHYDALNRVWWKDLPGATPDVYYGYDLRGLRTYARFGSDTGQGVTIGYDGFGHQASSTIDMGGFTRVIGHDFDADGDQILVTHPDTKSFVYDYDGVDRLSGIRENGVTSIVSQGYYPIGPRSAQTRAGVSTSFGYDYVERPNAWTNDLAGTGPDVTTGIGYNAANQLNSWQQSNDAYAYNVYANGTTGYTPNGLNQYANVGGVTLGYDSNGNLRSDGSTTYTYDVENRLLTASGAHTATLTYDPLGRLFQVVGGGTTTQFLYDGDELVAEYNGAGALQRRYVHGTQNDDPLIWYEGADVSAAARRSLQANYEGSIESVADASGHPIGINRYDDYGVPAPSNIGRFQYTGQIWMAELGLHYYKARFYDPRLGRFLQTDPVGYEDNLNLYAYAGDDPLNKTDPDGQFEWPWHFFITLIAGMKAHLGFFHSLALAWHTANVDFRPGSQGDDAEHANGHSMGGRVAVTDSNGNTLKNPDGTDQTREQTPEEAEQGTREQVDEVMESGKDIPKALHAVEDHAAPLHRGHPWRGMDRSFPKHFLYDVFPSPGAVREGYDNAVDVLTGTNPLANE